MKVLDLQTGAEVDLPESEVARRYAEGTVRTQQGARVPMRTAHGNLTSVAAEDIPSALAGGFTPATEAEFQRADMEARYSTPGQIALTGVEGAGRGLTFSGSDLVLGLALGDEYAEDARRRQQINPGTAIGGEIAGAVLPALVSGGGSTAATGASLGGRVLRGVTALPRLASRAGLAAEMATARALGEGASVGGRIARSAASHLVGGAVEALPHAAGRGLTQLVLDDDATMERVLAQVGLEAIAGGVAGGVIGGGSRAAREGYDAVARRLFGDATHPGLGAAMVRLSASLSGDSAESISRLALGDAGEGLLSESARRNRQLAFFGVDEARDRVARNLTRSLDDARKAVDTATDAFRGEVKTAKIASLLPDETAAAQLAAHDAQLSSIKAQLDDLLADRAVPWRSDLRRLRAAVDGDLPTNAAEAFAKADAVKRDLQSTVSAFAKAQRRSESPAIIARGREIIDKLDASAESLRTHLTTEQLFGAAAVAQREINEPWARMLAAGRNLEQQAKLFRTVDVGRYTETVADEQAINRYLGGLVDPKNDAAHAAMREYIDQGDAFVRAVEKHGGSPELRAAAEAYQSAAKTIKAGLAEAEDAIVLGNQARSLSTSGGLLDGDGGNMLGAGLSFALDSLAPLGITAGIGAAKMAANSLSRPGATLRKLASVERIVMQATQRLDSSVGQYMQRIAKGATDTAARTARAAARESAASKYERTRDRLDAASANPDAAKAAVARSTAALPETARAKMVDRVGAANGYLLARMPQPAAPVSPWDKPDPSDAELEVFARYVDAVEDPIGTLDRELKAGDLSSETVEVLRDLYPATHTHLVAAVSSRLSEMRTPPAYDDLVTLSLILDTPLDPSMQPERIAGLQDAYQYSDQGVAPTKPRAPSPFMDKIADSHASAAERLTV